MSIQRFYDLGYDGNAVIFRAADIIISLLMYKLFVMTGYIVNLPIFRNNKIPFQIQTVYC